MPDWSGSLAHREPRLSAGGVAGVSTSGDASKPSGGSLSGAGTSVAGIRGNRWPPWCSTRPCRPREVSSQVPGAASNSVSRAWHRSTVRLRVNRGDRGRTADAQRPAAWRRMPPSPDLACASSLRRSCSRTSDFGPDRGSERQRHAPGTGPGSRVGVRLGHAPTGIDGHVWTKRLSMRTGFTRDSHCELPGFAFRASFRGGRRRRLACWRRRGGRSAHGSWGRPSAAQLCCRRIVPKKI